MFFGTHSRCRNVDRVFSSWKRRIHSYKITRITEDNWIVSTNQSIQSVCEKVEQLEQAINRLNGVNKTLLVAETAVNMMLKVGGGHESRFVVQIIKGADEQFHTLCQQDDQTDDLVEVVSGGKASMHPVRHCVDEESALIAARYFAETLLLCPWLRLKVRYCWQCPWCETSFTRSSHFYSRFHSCARILPRIGAYASIPKSESETKG